MAETLFIVDPTPKERDRILAALSAEDVAVEIYDSGAQFLEQVDRKRLRMRRCADRSARASGCGR